VRFRVVGVSAAEGRSGLHVGEPGESVEAELLHGVRRGVATAEQNAADCSAGDDLFEEQAERCAKAVTVGLGSVGRA